MMPPRGHGIRGLGGYAFVDGAYLREEGNPLGAEFLTRTHRSATCCKRFVTWAARAPPRTPSYCGELAQGLFDVALLITGDADFVPLIHEVKRRGVSVVGGGIEKTTAKDVPEPPRRVEGVYPRFAATPAAA